MQVQIEKGTRFSDELKLIPGVAWALSVLALCVFQVVPHVIMAHPRQGHEVPPFFVRVGIGVFGGIMVAGWVLLIGYVNRDSGRRGMSRVIWTLLAIFVPNGLGIIIYFLLRQPMQRFCPHCSAEVQPGYSFCSKCGNTLEVHCANCGKPVQEADVFCPYCGKSTRSPVSPGQAQV